MSMLTFMSARTASLFSKCDVRLAWMKKGREKNDDVRKVHYIEAIFGVLRMA